MTYPSLLTQIYAQFDSLWLRWTSEVEKSGEIGVLAFLHEGYDTALSLQDAVYSYWTVEMVIAFLRGAGTESEGFEALVDDVSVAEEFLVLITEPSKDTPKQLVHVHRITRLG